MKDELPSADVRDHQPSESELRTAIEGLYDDELEPLGRLVRRRLLENIGGPLGLDYRNAPIAIDPITLRDVCERTADVTVVSLPRNEYAALLTDRVPLFVDVNSSHDPYPDDMWRQLTEYLASAAGTICFPCDRYECAKVLRVGGPPCLAGRTLGEVCHIASLAIGPRRLLERVGGSIVPLISAGARSKPGASKLQGKASPQDRHGEPLPAAVLEDVRACLPEMLDTSTCPAEGAMYLSQVALFRDRHNLLLSAEALGHDRLEDVFQSHYFADLCEVTQWGDETLLERIPRSTTARGDAQLTRPTAVATSWGIAGGRMTHRDRAAGYQAFNSAARYWPGHAMAGGPTLGSADDADGSTWRIPLATAPPDRGRTSAGSIPLAARRLRLGVLRLRLLRLGCGELGPCRLGRFPPSGAALRARLRAADASRPLSRRASAGRQARTALLAVVQPLPVCLDTTGLTALLSLTGDP